MLQHIREYSDTNSQSRRRFLTTGAAIAGLAVAGTTPTGAQSDEASLPLEIEIYAEDEYITITNIGDEAVDLTGYSVNFEAPEDDYDQSRALAGEVVIEAGASITVPTGAREVSTGTIVELQEPYEGEVLNNEEPDDVAIFDAEGNVVASSGDTGGDDDDEIGATLSVTVEDQDGNAVAGIGVVGIGPDAEPYSATTNSDGVAEYDFLTAGDYEFYALTDDTEYEESSTETITLEDGDEATITVTVTDTGEGDDGEDGADDGDDDSESPPDESDGEPDDSTDDGDDGDDATDGEGATADEGNETSGSKIDDCPKR